MNKNKKYTNTLQMALDALISIEHGALPTGEQLNALQLAVWSWMDGENGAIPTELFKQGSAIKRNQTSKLESLSTSLEVFEYMKKHQTSKTKAVQNLSKVSERTTWNHLDKSSIKTEQDANKFNDLMAVVEKALQKKT